MNLSNWLESHDYEIINRGFKARKHIYIMCSPLLCKTFFILMSLASFVKLISLLLKRVFVPVNSFKKLHCFEYLYICAYWISSTSLQLMIDSGIIKTN